ncbi:unnamed protein product [Closterium sp. NIES-53]
MTSLCSSGGSGDGSGGSGGSGGGRTSSPCGVSCGGEMQLQRRPHESHSPQQLREWYARRSGGGGSSGSRCAAVQLGLSGGGLAQLQRRPRETLTPQQLREWYVQRGVSRSSARCQYVIRTDYDAIFTSMYALTIGTEGDCFLCVLPDPSIEAAALGASESGTLPDSAPAEALHTFTLDSGASRYFFRDSTTLTPLPAPVPVRLANPSWGPVVSRCSTVLPCPAVPSGSLSSLHLPSFSTNLVSTAALQDAMVTTITPGGQRVSICTCTQMGRHLATFTRRPGSSLYTLATEPPQVAASAQVSASGQVAPLLMSPPVAPDSSLAPPPGSPLPATPSWNALPSPCLWSSQVSASPPALACPALPSLRRGDPARVRGQGRERYFLLVVDDFMQYTTVFPLRSKGQVVDVLIPWIRTVRLQIRERFSTDLPRRIGLVIEVARTSMIHADAPHFLWPFAVQYAAHQLNLWPRVSLPETSPTLRWTGKVGDVSVFRVWGSCAFVCDTSTDNFTTLPRAVSSPLRTSRPPPVEPLPPQGPGHSCVSQVDTTPGAEPGEVAMDSGAARGTASGGAELGGAGPGGVELEGVKPGGATSKGAESGGAMPQGAALSRGSAGASQRQPLQQLREWFVRRARLWSGAARAGGARVAAGAGVTRGTAATSPGGTRTRGTGAAGTGGVGGVGAGDPTES